MSVLKVAVRLEVLVLGIFNKKEGLLSIGKHSPLPFKNKG